MDSHDRPHSSLAFYHSLVHPLWLHCLSPSCHAWQRKLLPFGLVWYIPDGCIASFSSFLHHAWCKPPNAWLVWCTPCCYISSPLTLPLANSTINGWTPCGSISSPLCHVQCKLLPAWLGWCIPRGCIALHPCTSVQPKLLSLQPRWCTPSGCIASLGVHFLVITKWFPSRGSSPSLPANKFFLVGRPNFSKGQNPPKNRQTPNKERLIFWHDENCPPPLSRLYDWLQQCWSINRKIGDHQCTYYLIVRALTVADCCFFVVATILPQ